MCIMTVGSLTQCIMTFTVVLSQQNDIRGNDTEHEKVNIMTLVKMTLSIITLIKMTLSIMTLNIMTLFKMNLSTMALSKMTLKYDT